MILRTIFKTEMSNNREWWDARRITISVEIWEKIFWVMNSWSSRGGSRLDRRHISVNAHLCNRTVNRGLLNLLEAIKVSLLRRYLIWEAESTLKCQQSWKLESSYSPSKGASWLISAKFCGWKW
jgi:hypothetical protein